MDSNNCFQGKKDSAKKKVLGISEFFLCVCIISKMSTTGGNVGQRTLQHETITQERGHGYVRSRVRSSSSHVSMPIPHVSPEHNREPISEF